MSITDYFRANRRMPAVDTLANSSLLRLVAIAAIHLAAFVSMYLTEFDLLARSLFVSTWCFLNFFWLALLRRPAMAAALSLGMIEILILVSRFKFDIKWMTVNFLDVLIVDTDTIAFLFKIFPDLRTAVVIAIILAIPTLILIWRLDPYRIRPWIASLGGGVCLTWIIGLSSVFPERPWEQFQGVNHVSNFARSGVLSISEIMSRGWLEFDSEATERLTLTATETCQTVGKRPHIIMVLDESSFDITMAPGIRVPADYARHFRSFDGKSRSFLTETTGGASWYTEYNVLTGLSARSYGRLMFYVTRIAAGRVERGLPQALRRCGYKTFTLYPAYGAFLSARKFQTTTGIERLIDSKEMGAGDVEPDHFYYDKAFRLFARENDGTPLFIFVYTVANHFPWNTRFRPDLMPDWRDLSNDPVIDEYVRRQTMSARDYAGFIARLQGDYPKESFLLVRFGDHPPAFAAKIIDPSLDNVEIARRLMALDPRYYTAYYAIDAVNFKPVDLSSALDTLDAPYLPLVVLEAAGLPLDASFREQKTILDRCQGLFYRCNGGAEARRFNRLLIDAGLIKGM
jgi:Sulfatase